MKRSIVEPYLPYAIVALVLLTACEPLPPTTSTISAGGQWDPVDPPVGAPAGTTCWVWSRGIGSSAYGGPQCFTPERPTP